MSPRPVTVVGDVVTDVVVLLRGTAAPGSDRPATIRTAGGGAGANVAWHLARQRARTGTAVTLAGVVGDDGAGAALATVLGDAGVRVALRAAAGAASGTIVSLVEPDGERSMLADRAANDLLVLGDVPAPEPGSHLHVSGYTLLGPGSRAAGLAALAAARAAGCTVSVDPASTAPLAAHGVEAWLADTAGVDLLLPNAAEARLLTGCADPADAGRALAERHAAVAVTLGAEGALWCARGTVVHRPARPVDVVDTTGAGDAFTAGALSVWVERPDDAAACLEAGLGLAAEVVGRPGAR